MNRFGRQAMTHWQENLPNSYAAIENPEAHFTQMGEDLAQAIEELARQVAGSEPPGETYPRRVQRLRTARFEAEERVLREMLSATE